ncbi:hypothetical protein F5J12DRAFT_796243 [Pisolithus orientalis]|uniref:uncharacterized protein n=1 Tax=Pisolithus orientalis TaxID=936130 RepID=UPI0022254D9E|nr:uncharacterized protein F5J12DRAFT_796243 [Pisolithus orientalis]KAI6032760.1 hypothetical protein F5J12DRAFT_796243 [Pisolithus orientalis]
METLPADLTPTDVVLPPKRETLVHPAFDSPEADIIIVSKDLTCFRVHSFTLKTTSGWFRSLFTLPHPVSSGPSNSAIPSKETLPPTASTAETIHLDEDAETLEIVLRMISGLPITPFTSYDTVDAVLYASEKYDMPGPASLVRIAVLTPPLADQPLRLYASSSRFGWIEESRVASERTLALDLWSEENWKMLRKVDGPAALDLLKLHRSRREGVRKRLEEHPFVSGSTAALCARCRRPTDHHTWRELKYKIIMEMDHRPLGDTVLNVGLQEWPEAMACWEARCPHDACASVIYDKTETVRLIRDCIESLPKTT